jgi:hypothetical protein
MLQENVVCVNIIWLIEEEGGGSLIYTKWGYIT